MTPTLAAIVYHRGFAIDAFMAHIAERLRRNGLRIGGIVQHNLVSDDEAPVMVLEDIATGARFAISQNRGAAALGCRLDPAGLAAAGAALAAACTGGFDLLLVNKFGRQESAGQGLRAEIAEACLAGQPLLTAVREDMLESWEAFVGTGWARLPADADAAADWAQGFVLLPATHAG